MSLKYKFAIWGNRSYSHKGLVTTVGGQNGAGTFYVTNSRRASSRQSGLSRGKEESRDAVCSLCTQPAGKILPMSGPLDCEVA